MGAADHPGELPVLRISRRCAGDPSDHQGRHAGERAKFGERSAHVRVGADRPQDPDREQEADRDRDERARQLDVRRRIRHGSWPLTASALRFGMGLRRRRAARHGCRSLRPPAAARRPGRRPPASSGCRLRSTPRGSAPPWPRSSVRPVSPTITTAANAAIAGVAIEQGLHGSLLTLCADAAVAASCPR